MDFQKPKKEEMELELLLRGKKNEEKIVEIEWEP